MIQREGGLLIFECDECPNYIETGTDDFRDALTFIKEEFWRVAKNSDNEWVHFCPEHA